MFIPWEKLSAEALTNLIDSYFTQMHGLCSDEEFESLDDRRSQVLQALKTRKLLIRWSEFHESAWIVDPATVTGE